MRRAICHDPIRPVTSRSHIPTTDSPQTRFREDFQTIPAVRRMTMFSIHLITIYPLLLCPSFRGVHDGIHGRDGGIEAEYHAVMSIV